MSAAQANSQASAWTEPPWSGWIETTGDALLILEAARRGLIPRVTRRLVDSERKMITSGSVFVFDEDESGIKRWTDGFYWSPSRILGNFLLYRETDKRNGGHRGAKAEASSDAIDQSQYGPDGVKLEGSSLSRPKTDNDHLGVDKQLERNLMGSLTNNPKFKPDGLMKKTFSLTIGGVSQHLISYYKIEDVANGRLRSPSSLPELASLDISPEYLDKTHFRNPPKVEVGIDGLPRYRGEAEDTEPSPTVLFPPLSTGPPLITASRNAESPNASRRGKRFDPYNTPTNPKRGTRRPTKTTPEATPPTEPTTDSEEVTATTSYADPNVGASPPQPYPAPFNVPNVYGYPTHAAPRMFYSPIASVSQLPTPLPSQYPYGYGHPTEGDSQQPPPGQDVTQTYYQYPAAHGGAYPPPGYANSWHSYGMYPSHIAAPPPHAALQSSIAIEEADAEHVSSAEDGSKAGT